MMGNTHVAAGVATSILIVKPTDVPTLCATIIGGAIGGIICDIEVRSNRHCRDALYARITAGVITLVCLVVDYFFGANFIKTVMNLPLWQLGIGIAVALFSLVKGRFSEHRTFTHSLLFMFLLAISVTILFPSMLEAFMVGFLSHILLDLLNKKPVQVFYPYFKDGFCFKLCYAGKTANKVCLISFAALCVIEIGYFFLFIF